MSVQHWNAPTRIHQVIQWPWALHQRPVCISIFIPSERTPPVKMSWQVQRARLWLDWNKNNQLFPNTILNPGVFENNYVWKADSLWTIEQNWLKALCIKSRWTVCEESKSHEKKVLVKGNFKHDSITSSVWLLKNISNWYKVEKLKGLYWSTKDRQPRGAVLPHRKNAQGLNPTSGPGLSVCVFFPWERGFSTQRHIVNRVRLTDDSKLPTRVNRCRC